MSFGGKRVPRDSTPLILHSKYHGPRYERDGADVLGPARAALVGAARVSERRPGYKEAASTENRRRLPTKLARSGRSVHPWTGTAELHTVCSPGGGAYNARVSEFDSKRIGNTSAALDFPGLRPDPAHRGSADYVSLSRPWSTAPGGSMAKDENTARLYNDTNQYNGRGLGEFYSGRQASEDDPTFAAPDLLRFQHLSTRPNTTTFSFGSSQRFVRAKTATDSRPRPHRPQTTVTKTRRAVVVRNDYSFLRDQDKPRASFIRRPLPRPQRSKPYERAPAATMLPYRTQAPHPSSSVAEKAKLSAEHPGYKIPGSIESHAMTFAGRGVPRDSTPHIERGKYHGPRHVQPGADVLGPDRAKLVGAARRSAAGSAA